MGVPRRRARQGVTRTSKLSSCTNRTSLNKLFPKRGWSASGRIRTTSRRLHTSGTESGLWEIACCVRRSTRKPTKRRIPSPNPSRKRKKRRPNWTNWRPLPISMCPYPSQKSTNRRPQWMAQKSPTRSTPPPSKNSSAPRNRPRTSKPTSPPPEETTTWRNSKGGRYPWTTSSRDRLDSNSSSQSIPASLIRNSSKPLARSLESNPSTQIWSLREFLKNSASFSTT